MDKKLENRIPMRHIKKGSHLLGLSIVCLTFIIRANVYIVRKYRHIVKRS